jgi:putative DNA primase/helicase
MSFSEQVGTPPPVFSETDLADRFAARHASELRYVAEWGQWMRYDGKCWHEEKTLLAFDLVRALCREVARECNKSSEAKALTSAKTIAAIERIAKADRRIVATFDQWDADPWLLNTPEGVVDLRKGETRQHRPDDYMTKITAVAPKGDCRKWKEHMRHVMGGDEALVSFLQRGLGYSLTGVTREHALFFGHGGGGNGKGTTFETVARLMGDYARTAPMEVFQYSASDRHPTELAMLRGARFVTASETEEGRGWAESRIKTLTGGDRISARFMRQDHFEYIPQFKLWLSGNNKPSFRSVDDAIRRRFNLIPFMVKITTADKELPEKLKAEWPGILAWMIEGCSLWQRDGLKAPTAVTAATDEYLAAEDALNLWFEDCCVADPSADGLFTAELFQCWKVWAEHKGEYVMTERRFSQRLEGRADELGIKKANDLRRKDRMIVTVEGRSTERMVEKHGRGFAGVRFKDDGERIDPM